LPCNNTSAFGLKVYSDLVLGGKLRGLKEDKTYGGRTPGLQDDVNDNKRQKQRRPSEEIIPTQ
jgi:hypothetical protein